MRFINFFLYVASKLGTYNTECTFYVLGTQHTDQIDAWMAQWTEVQSTQTSFQQAVTTSPPNAS